MRITVGGSAAPLTISVGNTHQANPGTGSVVPLLLPDQIAHEPHERYFHGGRWHAAPAPDGFAPAPTVQHIPYTGDGVGASHRERKS